MYQIYIANQLVLIIMPVNESKDNYQVQMKSKNKIKVSFSLFLILIKIRSLNYYEQVKTNKDL